jgi:TetR/AcrR family transcriptional repressor of nem operon
MAKKAQKPAAKSCNARQCTTRQKLIEAAHQLIWKSSYAHVSVEDICRAAGVQKGSFYHFFPTKIDLAAAALEDHWEVVRPLFEALLTENVTPQAQLRALCREIFLKQQRALEETGMVCGCPYATIGAELNGSNESLRLLSEQITERFLQYYERVLKHAAAAGLIPTRGIPARAREMHTYAIGAMLQARIANNLESVGKSLETALFRISGMESAAARSPRKSALAPVLSPRRAVSAANR